MSRVEKAKIKDVPQMHQLVNYFADKGEMLPRPLSEMYENIRDYFVAREDGQMVGCVALHVSWSDLAEIKALAVAEKSQNKRVGARLVGACLKEAKALGIPTVFCLTYKPSFFKKVGFVRINTKKLPRKVWRECYDCPKFPDCDEVALIYNLEGEAKLG